MQDENGYDTAEANLAARFAVDERDYGVGASILHALGITKMRLMTNNPTKRAGLEGYGLSIEEIVPIVTEPTKYNERYLKTKEDRWGHKLGLSSRSDTEPDIPVWQPIRKPCVSCIWERPTSPSRP